MTSAPEKYQQQSMALRAPAARYLYRLQDMVTELGLPDAVKKEIDECLASMKARDEYCETITSSPSSELQDLFEETRSHPWSDVHKQGKTDRVVSARMMSGSLEGKFLKSLVSMSKARRVLEVGLFTGSGALAMAEALPADGVVVTCEISDYLHSLARKLVDKSPHGKKIVIKLGPANETLTQLANAGEKFDFIFLDADKTGYMEYYKIIMDNNLLSPGGTIAVDNALGNGSTYTSEEEVMRVAPESKGRITGQRAIKNFNEYVSKDERVNQVMVPIRDGVLLVQRKEDYEGQV